MKKIKIVNKYKLIRMIVILISLICVIIFLSNNQTYSNTEERYKIEYVTKGETLWEIAENEIKENSYFKNKNIQNVILEIKRQNNMTTSDLKEGMKLKIPIY